MSLCICLVKREHDWPHAPLIRLHSLPSLHRNVLYNGQRRVQASSDNIQGVENVSYLKLGPS